MADLSSMPETEGDCRLLSTPMLHRRRAPEAGALRAMQVAILRSVGETGHLPADHIIDNVAAASGKKRHEILSALHKDDYARINEHGEIVAAYPFSMNVTRHRVQLENGARVFAMCMIDALGIPAMLKTDATIHSSTDSDDGIRVVFRQGQVSWDPPAAVVVFGMRSLTGAAAEVCCQNVNFSISRTAAEEWANAHRELDTTVLSQEGAVRFGAVPKYPFLPAHTFWPRAPPGWPRNRSIWHRKATDQQHGEPNTPRESTLCRMMSLQPTCKDTKPHSADLKSRLIQA